jgi:hypothetical protein
VAACHQIFNIHCRNKNHFDCYKIKKVYREDIKFGNSAPECQPWVRISVIGEPLPECHEEEKREKSEKNSLELHTIK